MKFLEPARTDDWPLPKIPGGNQKQVPAWFHETLSRLLRFMALAVLCALPAAGDAKMPICIMDGRNNHE